MLLTKPIVSLNYNFSSGRIRTNVFGRTIYILGYSDPPGKLRTLKLERIKYAELLKKSAFTLPEDFDGPALLQRAWGVMYGEEVLMLG